jgi:hypothetical protein
MECPPIVGSAPAEPGEAPRFPAPGLLLIGTPPPSGSWLRQPGLAGCFPLVRLGALSPVQGLRPTPGRPRKPRSASSPTCRASTLPPREVQMNTTTKVSLVTILASCLLATMAIGSAHAAMRHHQAASACAAQPGTLRAFFCPAPAAPAKPLHHRHAKA